MAKSKVQSKKRVDKNVPDLLTPSPLVRWKNNIKSGKAMRFKFVHPRGVYTGALLLVAVDWLDMNAFRIEMRGHTLYLSGTVGQSSHKLAAEKAARDWFLPVGMDLKSDIVVRDAPTPSTVPPQPKEPPDPIANANRRALSLAWQLALLIENALNSKYAGRDFETRETKQTAVDEIRESVRKFALTVICPTCSRAATIRIQSGGTSPTGAIQFQHGSSTTHRGSIKMDPLLLVPIAAIGDDGRILDDALRHADLNQRNRIAKPQE